MTETLTKSALAELFREVFEGVKPGADGTWFVQGSEAIFNSIDSLTAEQASAKVPGQLSSIGAHAFHLTYYLELFNANLRGENPDSDWTGSWKVQSFDDSTWRETGARMKRAYGFARAWYESEAPANDEEQATYAAANLAHAAYHLGAIRALMPLVNR